MKADRLRELYVRCMNCPVPDGVCVGVDRNWESGSPPRGFQFTTAPVPILVVGKNPGRAYGYERELLAGKRGEELFRAFLDFQHRGIPGRGSKDVASGRFGRNLVDYLSAILERPTADLGGLTASTNLVKCSTVGEQDYLSGAAMQRCSSDYLWREIELLQPCALLALGREVERFLNVNRQRHGKPVFYVKHPSRPYARAKKAAALGSLRREIQPLISRWREEIAIGHAAP